MPDPDNMTDSASFLDESDRSRIQFLDNELDLCLTFLQVAEVEADSTPAAETASLKARQGYEEALTWIESVREPHEKNRLIGRLVDLGKKLDDAGFTTS